MFYLFTFVISCAFNFQVFCYSSNETGFLEGSNRAEHLMLLKSVNDTIIQGLKEMVFKHWAGIIQSVFTIHLFALLNPGFAKCWENRTASGRYSYGKSPETGLKSDVKFTCSVAVWWKESLLLHQCDRNPRMRGYTGWNTAFQVLM